MAEAMATGTPVIAARCGSVPEVVADGVTGFVCDTLSGMIQAVSRVSEIDRRACRERVERLFSPAAMASGYEAIYRQVIAEGTVPIAAETAIGTPPPAYIPVDGHAPSGSRAS
jgi:glycosyltransferase involved in cell wall biosynthesis